MSKAYAGTPLQGVTANDQLNNRQVDQVGPCEEDPGRNLGTSFSGGRNLERLGKTWGDLEGNWGRHGLF